MSYAFDFLTSEKITAAKVRTVLEDFSKAARDGWSCYASSSYCIFRQVSRWGMCEAHGTAYLKVISALMMSLFGSVCIFKGEERGLIEAGFAFEDLQDSYSIRFWPEFKGRDG